MGTGYIVLNQFYGTAYRAAVVLVIMLCRIIPLFWSSPVVRGRLLDVQSTLKIMGTPLNGQKCPYYRKTHNTLTRDLYVH
jgi:hypothetical protein